MYGTTPLHYASRQGCTEIVKSDLNKKCIVSIADDLVDALDN